MAPSHERPLQCPRCLHAAMLPQTWNGVRIRICMGCGTNWFEVGDMATFAGWGRDLPAAAEAERLHAKASVHCPQCGTQLERIRFPLDPPLEIERCPDCRGILLDYEEIRRMPEVGAWAAKMGYGRRSDQGPAPGANR